MTTAKNPFEDTAFVVADLSNVDYPLNQPQQTYSAAQPTGNITALGGGPTLDTLDEPVSQTLVCSYYHSPRFHCEFILSWSI